MNESTYILLLPILKDFAFYIGLATFIISLTVGLVLLIKPSLVERFNRHVGQYFSFRRSTKFLEMPNNFDRVFYRHHKIVGTLISVISAYVLYYFLLVYDSGLVAEFVKRTEYAVLYDIMLNTLRLFMLCSGVLILFIGITIIFRPSLIKGVETWANQWISTRQAGRPLVQERQQVNQLAFKYPRIIGLVIVILSSYASILLFMVYTR